MYSPTLGRFLQPDPIGYGDGMNLYAYVRNDPVNGVDPTGMQIVVTGYRNCPVAVTCLSGDDLRRFLLEARLTVPASFADKYGFFTTEIVVSGRRRGRGRSGAGSVISTDVAQADVVPQSEGPCPTTSAGDLATAVGYAETAHSAFEELADIEGGGRYLRPTGVVGNVVSSTATAVDSAARGETMDVTFMRIVLPTVGGMVGGALGAAGGSLLGPLGTAAGGFAGGAAGAAFGDYLADQFAADAPRPRGCR